MSRRASRWSRSSSQPRCRFTTRPDAMRRPCLRRVRSTAARLGDREAASIESIGHRERKQELSTTVRVLQGGFGQVALLDMDRPLVVRANRECHVLLKASRSRTFFGVRDCVTSLRADQSHLPKLCPCARRKRPGNPSCPDAYNPPSAVGADCAGSNGSRKSSRELSSTMGSR
jgi:hypothetical protein